MRHVKTLACGDQLNRKFLCFDPAAGIVNFSSIVNLKLVNMVIVFFPLTS